MMMWLWLGILLCCSGAVSASETALFGLSRRTLRQFARSRGTLRHRAYLLMQHPGAVLMTVLITNTAVNVAIFAVSFVGLRHLGHGRPVVAGVASVGVLVAVITLGEIVPKTITMANAARLAPAAAALVMVLNLVLTPIRLFLRVALVNPMIRLLAPSTPRTAPVTVEELRTLVEHSAEEGVIDSQEHLMLESIVAAGDVSVREVMTPRVDIRSVPITRDRESVLLAMRELNKRRMLVHGRDLDDLRGVLYARSLHLDPQASIASVLRPIHYVPEQINLVQLLGHFRQHDVHLSVVVDEYGGTVGMVSIKDVLAWMVGDSTDRGAEAEATTEQIDENTYRIPGNLSARLWAHRFSVAELDPHVDTVAGQVVAKLGRMPRVGDIVRIRNLTLTVERTHNRRIERIVIRREPQVPGVNGRAP